MDDYIAVLMGAFNLVPIVIEIWDKNYKCIAFNQAATKLGRPSCEFGTNIQPDGTDSWEFWCGQLKRAFEEEYIQFEYVTESKDGKTMVCEITARRLSYENKCVVVTSTKDVTAFKELPKEKERMVILEQNSEAKTRFLARMSHEIRTPITAVLGVSEIQLQNAGHPVHIEEAFAKIYNSAGVLLGIVNDILDLSKIEAGKMSIIEQKYEIASLVMDVMQLQLIFLGSKKIDFKVHIDEKLPAILIGDELRIKQILNNLLSNAFKYTAAGVIELSLKSHEGSKEGYVMLEIGIRDTGRGMSNEQLNILSGEYSRFHEKEARYVEGTGLGMSIVYNLVQLMNATIDITSKVDEGTNIIVKIPQIIGSKKIVGPNTMHGFWDATAFKRFVANKVKFVPEPMPYGRVLVVDDVETNLYVARGLLNFYQIQVETCTGGYDCIEKIKSGNVYDIVFMDHMMPDINGKETTKIMREAGYARPIVALTANALIGQAEEFLQSGFDDFVSKPIQARQLNEVLNKFVRDKQPIYVIEAARAESASYGICIDDYSFSAEIASKLRGDFVKSQKNVMRNLRNALQERNFKTAHRLAHSLKGLAGLIQEHNLVNAASVVENQLKNEEISPPHLDALDTEFVRVFEHLTLLQNDDSPAQFVSKFKIAELFNKLLTMLSEDDASCLEMIPEIRPIPETKVLIWQIENCDFRGAYNTLEALMDVLDIQKGPVVMSDNQVLEAYCIIEQLGLLLEKRSADALNFLDELKTFPGAEKIAKQIEDFDLKLAYKTLAEWKNMLDEGGLY